MSKSTTDIFPGHDRTPGDPFGCDRDCREWLRAEPRKTGELKDAILDELGRGPRVRLAILDALLVRLMREEKGALVKKINRYLGKR